MKVVPNPIESPTEKRRVESPSNSAKPPKIQNSSTLSSLGTPPSSPTKEKDGCLFCLKTIWSYISEFFEGLYNLFLSCGCRADLKNPFEKFDHATQEVAEEIKAKALLQPGVRNLSPHQQALIQQLALYVHSVISHADKYQKEYPDYPQAALIEIQLGNHTLRSQLYIPSKESDDEQLLSSYIKAFTELLESEKMMDPSTQLVRKAHYLCQAENRVFSFHHTSTQVELHYKDTPSSTVTFSFTSSGARREFTSALNRLMRTAHSIESLFDERGKLHYVEAPQRIKDSEPLLRKSLENSLDQFLTSINGQKQTRVLISLSMDDNPSKPIHIHIPGKHPFEESKQALLTNFDLLCKQAGKASKDFTLKAALITSPEKKRFLLTTVFYLFQPGDGEYRVTKQEYSAREKLNTRGLVSYLERNVNSNINRDMIVDKSKVLLLN